MYTQSHVYLALEENVGFKGLLSQRIRGPADYRLLSTDTVGFDDRWNRNPRPPTRGPDNQFRQNDRLAECH